MDQEVKLNYLKWLTQGLDIDMFEILSILILYSRGSLSEKLSLIYKLYCYEEDSSMQSDEFKFMLDKLSTSVGATLSIKKTLLLEIVKQSEQRVIPRNDKILESDFIKIMSQVLKEFAQKLEDITNRVDIFKA